MKAQVALLSTAYLAPVQYYSKLLYFDKITIEQHENYSKQSFRNRCVIASANGPLTLSIPVERTETIKTLIKDVRINYHTNWQKIHFKAIESAYRNSPYYQFYIDDIIPFYTKKHVFLFDFNNLLQQLILQNLDINVSLIFTDNYIFNPKDNIIDFRDSIHPKPRLNKPDDHFNPYPYPQVFDSKFKFIPDLSILDLLFNAGPDAKDILLKSVRP